MMMTFLVDDDVVDDNVLLLALLAAIPKIITFNIIISSRNKLQ